MKYFGVREVPNLKRSLLSGVSASWHTFLFASLFNRLVINKILKIMKYFGVREVPNFELPLLSGVSAAWHTFLFASLLTLEDSFFLKILFRGYDFG